MSEPSQSAHTRPKLEPFGPLGQLIWDAMEAQSYSFPDAARAVRKAPAALQSDETTTCSVSSVHRWIYSGSIPHPSMRRWVAAAFQIPPERLTEAIAAQTALQAASNEAESTRPDASALLAGLASTALLDVSEPWERLDHVLRHPARIDALSLTHLEQVLIALETVERHVDASALFGAVAGHLATITNLLRATMPSTMRQHLCSIAGETAGLAGRLYAQLNQARTASSYFHTSLVAAREANDPALLAYLIGVTAAQLVYRDDPAARLSLLRSASPQYATPATRVFLAAKEADTHALVGDRSSAFDALARAESAMGLVLAQGSPGDRPRAPWWPADTWLAGEQGATLARLGSYDDAEQLLTRVLATPLNTKHRLWLLTALARTRTGQREPEEAARVVTGVVADAVPLNMRAVIHEVACIRRELNAWKTLPAVRSLDQVLEDSANASA
jgi:hypothetical protein